MESVNYDRYGTGVPLTFVDSCVTNRKKCGLPGELERRKERICDDAYCAAEDGGVRRDFMMSGGKSAVFVRPCTSATACGA
jgi:hypothetical protein